MMRREEPPAADPVAVAVEHIGYWRRRGADVAELAAAIAVPARDWDSLTWAYAGAWHALQLEGRADA